MHSTDRSSWLSTPTTVHVSTVLNRDYTNKTLILIDFVDDSVVPTPGAVESLKTEPQGNSNTLGLDGYLRIDELDRRGRNLLWKSGHVSTSSRRPRDLKGICAQRLRTRAKASSLVSVTAFPPAISVIALWIFESSG